MKHTLWLSLFLFACGENVINNPMLDGGVVDKRSCERTLKLRPGRTVSKLEVGGEWNKFVPAETPMAGPDGGGYYSAKLTLPVGSYAYKFVLDGTEWILDPTNPYTKYISGTENSALEIDDCKTPVVEFVSLSKTASGKLAAKLRYVDGAEGTGLAAYDIFLDDGPVTVTAESGNVLSISAENLTKGKHRITAEAIDNAGRTSKKLYVPFWIEDEPFDFRDGMLYFPFTDRFFDGDASNNQSVDGIAATANFAGGDLEGITQKLEAGYFDALGVRTLWVSPPIRNPAAGYLGSDNRLYTGYHGYWPASPSEVDGRWGGNDAFGALVKSAHQRGIRVLVDLVLNHVHQDHPYYAQHKSDGWFSGDGSCVCGPCDWDTHAIDCWFTNYLPDVNYESFDATEQLIEDAIDWVRLYDVDGFRVDAVKHFVLAPTKRLRAKLRAEFEHTGPILYTVGETFTGGDDGGRTLIKRYIGDDKLHAQFDFPIYWNVLGTLATYSQSLRDLESASNASDSWFAGAPMSPFFGNHDVARFITQASYMLQGDGKEQAWNAPPASPTDSQPYERLRLALTYLFTQPGVPLLYYGDELGLPGAADPDNRRVMKWDGLSAFESTTLAHSKALGAARKELVALRRGSRRTLWIDDDLYVYARQSGTDVALVVIHRGEKRAAPIAMPIPSEMGVADGTVFRDRLSSTQLTVQNGQLQLDPGTRQSMVLAP